MCNAVLTEGDEGHDEDLGALAQEHRQQHALPGGPEHITMHLLPPGLLLGILLGRQRAAHSQSQSGKVLTVSTYKDYVIVQPFTRE